MGLELIIKINNLLAHDYDASMLPIKVSNEYPMLTWELDTDNRAFVDASTGTATRFEMFGQFSYDIRISDNDSNIGTDSFMGNSSQTGVIESQNKFWQYSGVPLVRGNTYYGQIRVIDESNSDSGWDTFIFSYNLLPVVSNITITPSSPSVNDDLQISYDFFDADGDIESGSIIRWVKNGVYQRQHDNNTIVNSRFMQNGDRWMVDIYPKDGYEFGIRSSSREVMVAKTSITVSNVNVVPKNPTINNILMADFRISDEIEENNVFIKWYINNQLSSSLNDEKYIKPSLSVDDTVRCEVKHISEISYVSSPDVIVVDSDFVVREIMVDGRFEPLDVSSVKPSVRWRTYIPDGKVINYISIRIGRFYEDDSIYSIVLNTNKEIFSIPGGLLQTGIDYYISIACSDTTTFNEYTSSHFRINGSNWEKFASNSVGWTIETLLFTNEITNGGHILRISDGTKFAEVKMSRDGLSLTSGSVMEYNLPDLFYVKAKTLTIAGKGNNIKVYIDRILVIDGTGVFTQTSDSKFLELGRVSDGDYIFNYKYFFYTVSGYFIPGESDEYTNLKFHTFMEFENNEVVALSEYINGENVFGLNPDNTNDNGAIYTIRPEGSINSKTVARTFTPINKINISPDKKKIVCAHSGGVTIINGYIISLFDKELIFVDNSGDVSDVLPNNNGWQLVQSAGAEAVYFDENGFNINTL